MSNKNFEKARNFFTEGLKFLQEENYDQSGLLIASMNTNHLEICRKISKLIN